MSTEQIKLLESIRDGIETGFQLLSGQIGQTNVRLGQVEASLGSRVGNLERQLEVTNSHLHTLVGMHSASSITLSSRADHTDKRITSLEHRVDKLEETG